MFPLRHAAARLLTSRSISIAARSRTITSFASLPTRPSRIVAPLQFQRRWATGEAEAKKEEEVPISQLQPTPEEEVENAIHEDSPAGSRATGSADAPQIAESANLTEATEEATSTATDSSSTHQAVDSTPRDIASATAGLTEDFVESTPANIRKPFRTPPTPKPTIYVGNLFFDVTENDLTKEFERFGTVKRTRLIRDVRGLSKGFGYLQFETTDEAQNAVDEMNQQLFEGRRLMVSFANTDDGSDEQRKDREHKPMNPPSKTLFIGNMSFEMTDRDLNNLFRGIRNVIDVRVAIDRRTGQPRGFAHADFVDVKSAMEAMKTLAGKENYGRKLRIDYSYGPSTAPRNTPR